MTDIKKAGDLSNLFKTNAEVVTGGNAQVLSFDHEPS